MTSRTRLVTEDDAPALARLVVVDREAMAPYEPVRTDEHYTEAGQRRVVRDALAAYAHGSTVPHVIVDDGEVVGRITLNDVVRGPFQSCSVGYWVGSAHQGRGLATDAVEHVKRVAFEDMRLHRIQAGTLLDNVASQRVLARTGFERIGMAPRYLHIAGRWQDHLLFQVLAPGG